MLEGSKITVSGFLFFTPLYYGWKKDEGLCPVMIPFSAKPAPALVLQITKSKCGGM